MKKAKESKKEEQLKIKDLVQATGLSRQTILYYLMLGLIQESSRTPGRHRVFSPQTISKIKLIRKLNQSGYSLKEIRELFAHRLTR